MPDSNHYAYAEMMIRKPVSEVFNSFIDPEVTSKFWYSRGSKVLVEGDTSEWFWDMYGFSVPVNVKKIIPNQLIIVEWGEEGEETTIEWSFKELTSDKTFVTIKNYGFPMEGEALLSEVRDCTGGFTFLLSGCKAYLEHGIQLNLVADKFPPEMRE